MRQKWEQWGAKPGHIVAVENNCQALRSGMNAWVFDYMQLSDWCPVTQIARGTGLPLWSVLNAVKRLLAAGAIERSQGRFGFLYRVRAPRTLELR